MSSAFVAGEEGPYNFQADARQEIQEAILIAQQSNQNILLIFGANWCPWCRALQHLFQNNNMIHNFLRENFQVVMVDVGRRDKNVNLDSLYRNPVELGLPALVVFDKDGHFLTRQETGSLEYRKREKKGHDPVKVIAFLKKWRKEAR